MIRRFQHVNGEAKEAARRNIEKAREVQSERAHGGDIPRSSEGMITAEEHRLPDPEFAFPEERKEPLTDAAHMRNAIARVSHQAFSRIDLR